MKKVLTMIGAGLLTLCSLHATPVTINFPSEPWTTGVADLNYYRLEYRGVTMDAGDAASVQAGNGGPLIVNTYPPASDLIFNFASPIDTLSVTFMGPGNLVGISAFDQNTTAADGFALSQGSHKIAYTQGYEGNTLTLNYPSFLAVQIEGLGSTLQIQSISFSTAVPEPTVCGLMGLGGLGLVIAHLRRRRSVAAQ